MDVLVACVNILPGQMISVNPLELFWNVLSEEGYLFDSKKN